jgi:hypothetical protein
MIILSLEGLGVTHKKLSPKRLFSVYRVDLVMLHEMMCDNWRIAGFLSSILKD